MVGTFFCGIPRPSEKFIDGYNCYLYGYNTRLTTMATAKPKFRAKKPLKVQLLNASGKVIEAIIPSGKWPEEDPTLAIAKELRKYKHLKPTPIP